jgi:hypothetical protein
MSVEKTMKKEMENHDIADLILDGRFLKQKDLSFHFPRKISPSSTTS